MKLLIFDLLGVIVPNKIGGSKKNIKELYDAFSNKSVLFDEFYERYKKYIIGQIERCEFWEGITQNIDEAEENLINTYEIYSNMEGLFNRLNINYTVVALSNHPSEWIELLTKKYNLDSYFSKIFVSGKIGLKKPQIELYKMVLDEFGANNGDCVIIDDQNKNLITAAQLGIKTIHLKVHDDPIEFKPDLEISYLDKLLDYFSN